MFILSPRATISIIVMDEGFVKHAVTTYYLETFNRVPPLGDSTGNSFKVLLDDKHTLLERNYPFTVE